MCNQLQVHRSWGYWRSNHNMALDKFLIALASGVNLEDKLVLVVVLDLVLRNIGKIVDTFLALRAYIRSHWGEFSNLVGFVTRDINIVQPVLVLLKLVWRQTNWRVASLLTAVEWPVLDVQLAGLPQSNSSIRERSHGVLRVDPDEGVLVLSFGLGQCVTCHGNDGTSNTSFQERTVSQPVNNAGDSLRKVHRTAGVTSDYIATWASPRAFVTRLEGEYWFLF